LSDTHIHAHTHMLTCGEKLYAPGEAICGRSGDNGTRRAAIADAMAAADASGGGFAGTMWKIRSKMGIPASPVKTTTRRGPRTSEEVSPYPGAGWMARETKSSPCEE